MEKKIAMELSHSINELLGSSSCYNITRKTRRDKDFPKLPFLKSDHNILSLFEIIDGDHIYYLTICNWRRNKNYYLIVHGKFPGSRGVRILTEMRNYRDNELSWKYTPSKNDKKNNVRKDRFIEMYGSVTVTVSLPGSGVSLDAFLSYLLRIAEIRIAADELDYQFLDKESDVFPEGRRIERLHKFRERNSKVVQLAKKEYREKNGGNMPCEVCGVEFSQVYGDRGSQFIEAHHRMPLANLGKSESATTSIEQLAMVCANCHRMLHRNPSITVEELSKSLQVCLSFRKKG